MSGLLLLTREDPKDDRMALEAERDGQEVVRLGLLGTEPGKDGGRFTAWLAKAPADAAIAWTSRRAAEAVLALLSREERDALGRLPLFAVGAESAGPLAEAGFTVEHLGERPDAVRLAGKIVAESGRRGIRVVAFLHGDRALPDLPRTLREAGLQVEPFELYRIRLLAPDVSVVERAIEQGRQILAVFFSPSGVDALERLLPHGVVERFRAEAWTMPHGATTGRALRDRGYARVPAPLERDPADGPAGRSPGPAAHRSTGPHP